MMKEGSRQFLDDGVDISMAIEQCVPFGGCHCLPHEVYTDSPKGKGREIQDGVIVERRLRFGVPDHNAPEENIQKIPGADVPRFPRIPEEVNLEESEAR